MRSTVLIVEDDSHIRKLLRDYLQSQGYGVAEAANGKEALECWEQIKPDLILLDIMLPYLSGLEVLKTIRMKSMTPVILLTAKSDEVDKVLGLGLGADDYVTKPFSSREVAARIEAILRRTSAAGEPASRFLGRLRLDTLHYEAEIGGRKLDLTSTEFKILALLAEHPGRVYTRLQILERLYGDAYEGYERTIDTHINRIRRKLENAPGNQAVIKAVYGVGYRLLIDGEKDGN